MKLSYECPCEQSHDVEGSVEAGELSGYTTDLQCDCGAVYAISVTMLREPNG
jgi:hypothetical protein